MIPLLGDPGGCGGDLERMHSKDEVLTRVSMHWFTGTIGSSMRMCAANGAIPPAQLLRRVEVPEGDAEELRRFFRPFRTA